MTSPIVTMELNEQDAHRLLWLVQREAAQSPIWDAYWQQMAANLQNNINNP